MIEAAKPDDQVRDWRASQVTARVGAWLARIGRMAATAMGAAAIVVLLVLYYAPVAGLSLPGSGGVDSAGPAQPPRPPQPPRAFRPPTVQLPSLGLALTVPQLQQEATRVAHALRDCFPQLPEALHVVAMMHAQLRQTKEAENLWKKCVELAPDREQFRINLAAIAMDQGNSELAVRTLQETVEGGSTSPDVLHHLGVALADIGRCEEAEHVIDKAVALYPQSRSHWLVLGQTQLKLGKPAAAETSLRRALALGAASAELHFGLANACARQGKDREAESHRQQFIEAKGKQSVAARDRFQVLTLAEARQTTMTVLSEAAAVHLWQGNSLEAERLLLRAIALDPRSPQACRLLGDLYRQARMKPEERIIRQRLIEIEPDRFDNYLELATIYMELDEAEAAEAALKLAIAIAPDSGEGYTALAQIHFQAGKLEKARWFAQEGLRRQPSAPGYAFLAAICRLAGDHQHADAADAMAQQLEQKASSRTSNG